MPASCDARAPARPIVVAAALLLACASAPDAAAQNARPAERVDTTTTTSASSASIAVSGDRALVVYEYDGRIGAVRSSDRGVTWSAPVRVDTDPSASFKYAGRNSGRLPLALFGQRAHTVWRDTRNGDADLCYSRSLNGGASWTPEFALDEGSVPAGSPVRDFAFGASTSGGIDTLHVLFSVEPGTAGPEDLYLTSSYDGGASFAAARPVSGANGTGADVDQLDLLVVGTVLHVAWIDDRNGADDVYYRRSVDGGLSFTGPEVRLDQTPPAGGDAEDGVTLAATGNVVAVGWMEELGGSREQARVAISTDGGATFGAPRTIGGYVPNVDDVDELVLRAADGVLYAAWADDRNGLQGIYTSRSTNAGQSWSTDFSASNGYGTSPRLVAIDGQTLLAWVGGPAPGVADEARARSSRDDGLTWSSIVQVSSNVGDVDLHEPVVDPLYDNVVSTWLADDLSGGGLNDVWVGGYRPMTQAAVGWQAGPTTGRFDFSGFSGEEPFVWVLGSDTRGLFRPGVAGDPRITGLTLDATLQFTLEYPNLFAALIAPDGSGSTASFPIDLPVGTTIYTMAVSFGLAPARLGEFTDVTVLSL